MALFYISANLSTSSLMEDSWILLHSCIQSVVLSHITKPLENSTVDLWEKESKEANSILMLWWKHFLTYGSLQGFRGSLGFPN